MTPRRILLLCYEFPPFRGGIARVVHGMATGMAGLGHDVHVLAPDYLADQSAVDRDLPFHVHRFRGDFCSILSIDKLSRFAWLCRRTVRRIGPDIVHATDPQSQMALTLLARLHAVGDYSCTVHGTEILRYRHETMPRLWMHRAMTRPRAVFTVSEAVKAMLLANLPAIPDRVHVVHPGVDAFWFDSPRADRLAVRRQWHIPDHAFLCLTVARRVRHKGHDLAIAGLASLPDELRARCTYVVVGTGPAAWARTLAQQAEKAGVHLVLTDQLDDAGTLALVDAADLCIMLSRDSTRRVEGFGIALMEAAARGLPALATRTGGVPEAVLDGETGFTIPRDASGNTLAHVIARLAADPGERERLGSNARARARQFTWSNHASRILAALHP